MTHSRRRYAFLFQVSLTFNYRDSISQSVDSSDSRLGLLVYPCRVQGLNPTFPRREESTLIPENPTYGFRRCRYACGHHRVSSAGLYLQIHRVTPIFTPHGLWPLHRERCFWSFVCYRGGLLVSLSCHAIILCHTANSTCRITFQPFR